MIAKVTKATWLGKSRVNVIFQDNQHEDVRSMPYDDLKMMFDNLPTILTDVFWLDKSTQAPSWFIEMKRMCCLNNNETARNLFGFNDVDVQRIAAVFTNDLSKPVNIVSWMLEDATPEMIKQYGLEENVKCGARMEFAPQHLVNLARFFSEEMEMSE